MMTPEYIAAQGEIEPDIFDGVWADVFEERIRQIMKHGDASVGGSWLEQEDRKDYQCLSVLTEEVGEVARAINEDDLAELETELIQIAAVCSAWVENIRRYQG